MAISVVQHATFNGASSGSFGGNVSSLSTVFLTMFMYHSGAGTGATSNPLFGGAAVAGAVKLLEVQNGGSNWVYAALWMLPALAGGAASVALTASGGTVDGNVGMTAIEVSGLGASPALDSGASPNPETGSGLTGAIGSGSTGNITSQPQIILGAAVGFGLNITPPASPWTSDQVSGFCADGWQVVTSSGGSYAYNVTGATGAPWVAGVAAVMPGGGAIFTAPPNRPRGQAVNRASTY